MRGNEVAADLEIHEIVGEGFGCPAIEDSIRRTRTQHPDVPVTRHPVHLAVVMRFGSFRQRYWEAWCSATESGIEHEGSFRQPDGQEHVRARCKMSWRNHYDTRGVSYRREPEGVEHQCKERC